MLGIHVHKSIHTEKYRFLEHVLMIQALSAYQWKKTNGKIKLYTTQKDLEFFRELGMDKLYDEIDTEVLEKEIEVFWPHFYPASKIVVLNSLKREDFPATFIDTDLIFNETVSLEEGVSLAYLHDEALFNMNYPPLNLLGKREDYVFPDFPELNFSNPVNVGFVIFNDFEFAKEFSSLSLKYMRRNYKNSANVEWAKENLRTFWKSLFAEQRLLGAFAVHKKVKTQQIFPYTYLGDIGAWKSKTSSAIVKSEVMNTHKLPFFHLWGEKDLYESPENFHLKLLTFYKLATAISGVPELQEVYFNLLSYTAEKTHSESGEDTYQIRDFIQL
jgi:hypothetical protein